MNCPFPDDLDPRFEYFGMRVHGDRMNGLCIDDGDIITVCRQDEVEQGAIAVVLVNGEYADVSRFYSSGTTVTLIPHSTNPEHKPYVYDRNETTVRVLGKVKMVRKRL